MLVVSTREFRQNQKNYLDKVDAGDQVFIQRGKDRCYTVFAVKEDDTVVNKEYILSPDKELARAITAEELINRLTPRIGKLFDE
jgi:hypothetical protein